MSERDQKLTRGFLSPQEGIEMVYDPLLEGLGGLSAILVILALVGIALSVLVEGILVVFRHVKDGPDRRKREHLALMRRVMEDMNNGGVDDDKYRTCVPCYS
jgi:uncharacterized membrane protein